MNTTVRTHTLLLDLSNTYNKSPELLLVLQFSKLAETGLFSCTIYNLCLVPENMSSSMGKNTTQGTPGHFVLFYNSTTKWHLKAINNNQVNKFGAKFRTDRDPAQFGHKCPQPGRSLPEVTISWTAEGHTGRTGSG